MARKCSFGCPTYIFWGYFLAGLFLFIGALMYQVIDCDNLTNINETVGKVAMTSIDENIIWTSCSNQSTPTTQTSSSMNKDIIIADVKKVNHYNQYFRCYGYYDLSALATYGTIMCIAFVSLSYRGTRNFLITTMQYVLFLGFSIAYGIKYLLSFTYSIVVIPYAMLTSSGSEYNFDTTIDISKVIINSTNMLPAQSSHLLGYKNEYQVQLYKGVSPCFKQTFRTMQHINISAAIMMFFVLGVVLATGVCYARACCRAIKRNR